MEIQIGDFICYLFDTKVAPLLFGRITGFDKTSEGIYFHILPNHPDFPFSKGVVIKAKYQKNKFFLISNGINERDDEIVFGSNKVYAIFKSELTFAENLLSIINGRPFAYSFLSDKEKTLGEIAFKECHKELFGSIYSWAGEYRKNEVVVGNKDCETLQFEFIHDAIKKCLRRCNRTSLSLIKNRESIIIFLTNLHKELAWIHPFIDGNGRAIRLYLQIISLTLGFNFKVNTLCNSTGAKRRYHYAVKLSIRGNNKYLMALFDRAIEEL
ncbi:TPA: Fic family protein [Yersinia enterocolitica]|nr:Fic family protein [Yersinia enterocolitica]